jgi:hypothetical protein
MSHFWMYRSGIVPWIQVVTRFVGKGEPGSVGLCCVTGQARDPMHAASCPLYFTAKFKKIMPCNQNPQGKKNK